MAQQLKEVRAVRTGSYDGHRRRVGAQFYVAADAKENWFVDVGPAPADAELPNQLPTAQAPRGKSFVEIMQQLGLAKKPQAVAKEQTLAEALSERPVLPPVDADRDLVS
jgi:hypothetical protein